VEDIASQFVKEILIVQPGGPYFLAGQCDGGIVVLEIARQLQQQGHEIATLMQFDTPIAGYFKKLPWHNKLLRALGRRRSWQFIYNLGKNKFRRIAVRRTPRTTDYIWSVIWDAVRAYGIDRKIGCEVTLFRAEQQYWWAENVATGWDRHDAVKIYDVPGDHPELLTVPAAQYVIQRVLEESHRRSSTNGAILEKVVLAQSDRQ
jgi:thioesterase domain-containing protein